MPDATDAKTNDRVRLRLDRTLGMWVVTGNGRELRFRSYVVAEAEAMRRAGFRRVAPTSIQRSR